MSDSEKPAGIGIFGGKLGDESEPVVDPGPFADDLALLQEKVRQLTEERDTLKKQLDETADPADPARKRRAIRRLQGPPSSDFEEIIDLFYEWRRYNAHEQLTSMMRTVFEVRHHNLSDRDAITVMKDKIKETRMSRLNGAISRLGLEEAEKLLLGAQSNLPRSHVGNPCRVCGESWTSHQCPGEPF